MAISAVHYQLLKEHAPLFARGGSLLEIGEANWYGDMDPRDIAPDAADVFAIAKVVYRSLFAPAIVEAVDINGTPNAMRQNLNAPLELPRQYDVVINHGTAEHVFNIAQGHLRRDVAHAPAAMARARRGARAEHGCRSGSSYVTDRKDWHER